MIHKCHHLYRLGIALWALSASLATGFDAGAQSDPVLIGLDADMSSGTAQGGEAIRRGALVAIDEINRAGGVVGRPLRLVVRDHHGIPSRGKDNIKELANMRNLIAIIGGVHTPVAMAELDLIHRRKVIYLGAWAAGTPIVDNNRSPNYVFRVSVRDQFAGDFLLRSAVERGFTSPGLLLERTGWGRSNYKAMSAAAKRLGAPLTSVQWFNWGAKSLAPQLNALKTSNADVIILVSNPREGALAVQTIAREPVQNRLPIISHWGITGGNFPDTAGPSLHKVDLAFLQTYSFILPPFPGRAKRFLRSYATLYPPAQSADDVFSPVGSAHAYDLVHLLSKAITRAGVARREAVRNALESGIHYNGLVRNYAPAFTKERHDALDQRDFSMARFDRRGVIVPASE